MGCTWSSFGRGGGSDIHPWVCLGLIIKSFNAGGLGEDRSVSSFVDVGLMAVSIWVCVSLLGSFVVCLGLSGVCHGRRGGTEVVILWLLDI